jgi:DNA-binding YbaB/EbfC family protein
VTEPETPGPPGLPDLGGLLEGFQRMQEAQTRQYEGQAGGGAVRVTANGAMQFTSITIAPEAVDPDDVEMLQDLVLAALHDLSTSITDAQRDAIGFDVGGLGDSLGGLLGEPPPGS